MKTSVGNSDKSLVALTATAIIFHVIINATTAYGYFRDEFYYIACSEHLAFGYVDQPPLSVFFLAISRFLFGDSLVALRLFPALAHAAIVFLTGRIAKELGGDTFAQTLAALSSLVAPVFLAVTNFYSMNAFDILFWTIAMFIVVKILKEERKELWLWFGVAVGLGAQNKYSIIFLCFGGVVGLLLTSARKYLLSREFWIGAAIAAIIFIPHIIWQAANAFPTAEFIRNATLYKNVENSPLEFLTGQTVLASPFLLPLWGIGLWYFFFSKNGKQFRLFGWCYLSIFALFVLQRGKPYYLAPIYPILFAGGATAIAQLITTRQWHWLKPTAFALILCTALLSPMALPILPVETFIAFQKAIGIEPPREENHEMGKLPQHFADMFGWEEKVAAVARAFQKLSPEEQAKCAIVADNYGRAGAIDFFGNKYGLPKAISRHNNYWLWGTRGYTGEVVIVLGGGLEDKQQLFESVEVTETVQCEYCMPYKDNLRVFVCRGIKVPLDELWRRHRLFN
jgi:hypothetical protein